MKRIFRIYKVCKDIDASDIPNIDELVNDCMNLKGTCQNMFECSGSASAIETAYNELKWWSEKNSDYNSFIDTEGDYINGRYIAPFTLYVLKEYITDNDYNVLQELTSDCIYQ